MQPLLAEFSELLRMERENEADQIETGALCHSIHIFTRKRRTLSLSLSLPLPLSLSLSHTNKHTKGGYAARKTNFFYNLFLVTY